MKKNKKNKSLNSSTRVEKKNQQQMSLWIKTKRFLSRLIFGQSDIWENENSDGSQDTQTNLRAIILRKQLVHKRLRITRMWTVIVFVFVGFAGILGSSYFVGKKFFESSFQQGYNPFFQKTGRIILHFDKKPGEASLPAASSIVSTVQQNINILFSNKIINNSNWSPSSLNVTALSANEVSITGPQDLISQVSSLYKMWSTTDQVMTLTDQLGDTMTCGVTTDQATKTWIHNLLVWDKIYYGANIDTTIEANIMNQIQKISEVDCGSFLGKTITTNVFSNVTNIPFANGSQEKDHEDYSLSFTVSDTAQWTAFTKFLYDVTNLTLYSEMQTANPTEKVFTSQTSDDKKAGYNHYLHMYMFFWYGKAPVINPNANYVNNDPTQGYAWNSTPWDISKDRNNPSTQPQGTVGSYFDNLFIQDISANNMHIINSYTVEGNESYIVGNVTYLRKGDNPFFTTVDKTNSYILNPIYAMTQDSKDNKVWEQSKLIGIFTVDFDSSFKAGSSSTTIDFTNGSGSSSTNNLTYAIHSNTPNVKNDSQKSSLAVSNSIRNSLGTYFTKILSVTLNGPLMFLYSSLLFALIGFLLVFLGLAFYLIYKYRWLGAIAIFALIAFVYSMFAAFVIFQTNFQPSMVIITIVGFLIMALNTILLLDKFTKAYNVPKEKTLLETVLERNRKIFYKFLEFNVPLFITLYLGFTMILQALSGANILWMAFMFAMFIIISGYVMLFTTFLLENNRKIRKNYRLLALNANIESDNQVDKDYFYTAKSSDLNIEEVKIIEEKFLTSEEEDTLIAKETKKLNRKSTKALDDLYAKVGDKDEKNKN